MNSTKYYCGSCEKVFDEPKSISDRVAVCPYCKSDDIDTVNVCKCGNVCTGSNEWCDDCHYAFQKFQEVFMDDMKLDSVEMQELVAEHYERI